MRTIVGEELLAISYTNLEDATLNDFIAPIYTVIELFVGCIVVDSCDIVSIHTPVEIELGKKCGSHPVVWLTICGYIVCLAQAIFLIENFEKFAFNPLGHFGTGRTVDNLAILKHMVHDGSIAIELHHPEVIVGTHGTERSHQRIVELGTTVACYASIGV